MAFYDPALERFAIRMKKRMTTGSLGEHGGHGRGGDGNFYGHRKYQAGDDLRHMDWKAYGRTRQLYLKEYTAEKELPVYIFIDQSQSMNEGTPAKWQLAKTLALQIAAIAYKQNDAVAIYGVSDELSNLWPLTRGRDQLYGVEERLDAALPQGKASFEKICEAETLRQGVVFILTDGFEVPLETIFEPLTACEMDIRWIQIHAPEEQAPELEGALQLVDSETGAMEQVVITPDVLASYQKAYDAFLNQCQQTAIDYGVRYTYCLSNAHPLHMIAECTEVK